MKDDEIYKSLADNILLILEDSPYCQENQRIKELKKIVESNNQSNLQGKVKEIFKDNILLSHIRLQTREIAQQNMSNAYFHLKDYSTTIQSCKEKLNEVRSHIDSYGKRKEYLKGQLGLVGEEVNRNMSELRIIEEKIASLSNKKIKMGHFDEYCTVISSALNLASTVSLSMGNPAITVFAIANFALNLCTTIIRDSKRKKAERKLAEQQQQAMFQLGNKARDHRDTIQDFSQLSTDINEFLQLNNNEYMITKMQEIKLLQNLPKELYPYLHKEITEAESKLDKIELDLKANRISIELQRDKIRNGKVKYINSNRDYSKFVKDFYGVNHGHDLEQAIKEDSKKTSKESVNEKLQAGFFETDAGKKYLETIEEKINKDPTIIKLRTASSGLETEKESIEKEKNELSKLLPTEEAQRLNIDTQERREKRETSRGITVEKQQEMRARRENFQEKLENYTEVHDELSIILEAGNSVVQALYETGLLKKIGITGEIPSCVMHSAICLNEIYYSSVKLSHISTLIDSNPLTEWSDLWGKLREKGKNDGEALWSQLWSLLRKNETSDYKLFFQTGFNSLKVLATVVSPAAVIATAGIKLTSILTGNYQGQQMRIFKEISHNIDEMKDAINNLKMNSDIYFKVLYGVISEKEKSIIREIQAQSSNLVSDLYTAHSNINQKLDSIHTDIQAIGDKLDAKERKEFKRKIDKIRAETKGESSNHYDKSMLSMQFKRNIDYLKKTARKGAKEDCFTHINRLKANIVEANGNIDSDKPELSISALGYGYSKEYEGLVNPRVYVRSIKTVCMMVDHLNSLKMKIDTTYCQNRFFKMIDSGKELQKFLMLIHEDNFWNSLFSYYYHLIERISCESFSLLEKCIKNINKENILNNSDMCNILNIGYFSQPSSKKMMDYYEWWNNANSVKNLSKEIYSHYQLMNGYIALLALYASKNLRSVFNKIPNSETALGKIMLNITSVRKQHEAVEANKIFLREVEQSMHNFMIEKNKNVLGKIEKYDVNNAVEKLKGHVDAMANKKM